MCVCAYAYVSLATQEVETIDGDKCWWYYMYCKETDSNRSLMRLWLAFLLETLKNKDIFHDDEHIGRHDLHQPDRFE